MTYSTTWQWREGMGDKDELIKLAKKCHTREAWLNLFTEHREEIATSHSSRHIAELFKALKEDPQSLNYGVKIWRTMLEGCLSSWNLALGREIVDFTTSIASPMLAIPSAEIHMESGSPSRARKIANRALRLANIEIWEQLQLQMIVCNSYVEEGKEAMAVRLLEKMEQDVINAALNKQNLANFLINMARAQFFLGRYLQAAKIFYQAYELYLSLGDWEAVAKSLFNTAACYDNSGAQYQEQAFTLVEKCQILCEQHKLEGPLSHCYAFYGTGAYQRGNFKDAAAYYRKALDLLPDSEKSFRRLHIISMLTFTFLKAGRFNYAERYGQHTLTLANLDKSERFRFRYLNLKAELDWQRGNIESSHKLLEEETKPLFHNGVKTLEELSTLSRYYIQCSQLNLHDVVTKVKIAEPLKSSTAPWLEYQFSLGMTIAGKGRFAEADKILEETYEKAASFGANYHKALALLGMLEIKLMKDEIDPRFREMQLEFEATANPLGDCPLHIHIDLLRAAVAYRTGDFPECVKRLQSAAKSKRAGYTETVVIQSWLATIAGHSPKLSPWQQKLVTKSTKVYFAPTFENMGNSTYRISRHYIVELGHHPVIRDLIDYLLSRNQFTAQAAELQQNVWGQSLSLQGWQQKIRNTIMRIREFFPQTIAPLILHSDNQIGLFHEAIQIKQLAPKNLTTEEHVLKLLQDGPLSTVQLSNTINTSSATTKRILKRLTETHQVSMVKDGRNVFYQALEPESGSH